MSRELKKLQKRSQEHIQQAKEGLSQMYNALDKLGCKK